MRTIPSARFVFVDFNYFQNRKRNEVKQIYVTFLSDGKIPRDSTLVIDREVVIPSSLYISMSISATLGIFLATFFFTFNILYKENR